MLTEAMIAFLQVSGACARGTYKRRRSGRVADGAYSDYWIELAVFLPRT